MPVGKRKGTFSIILVPSGGAKPRTITLTRRGVWTLLGVASVGAALVVFSIVVLAQVAWFSFTIARLQRENTELKEEHGKVTRLEMELNRLGAVEKRLLALLGVDTGTKQAVGKSREAAAGQPGAPLSQARVGGEAGTPDLGVQARPGGMQPGTAAYSRSLPTLWPVLGEISESFSYSGAGHKGLDIATPIGTEVKSAGDGSVEFAGQDDVFGLLIIINHGSGITSLYGHNSKLAVARGDEVVRGQVIAYSGTSGKSSAPHLHFEISRYGKQVDPLTFLGDRE